MSVSTSTRVHPGGYRPERVDMPLARVRPLLLGGLLRGVLDARIYPPVRGGRNVSSAPKSAKKSCKLRYWRALTEQARAELEHTLHHVSFPISAPPSSVLQLALFEVVTKSPGRNWGGTGLDACPGQFRHGTTHVPRVTSFPIIDR